MSYRDFKIVYNNEIVNLFIFTGDLKLYILLVTLSHNFITGDCMYWYTVLVLWLLYCQNIEVKLRS